MSAAAEMRVRCELHGGPGCGGAVEVPLGPPSHLFTFPSGDGRQEVWSYLWVGRSNEAGWVLQAERFVCYQGVKGEKSES